MAIAPAKSRSLVSLQFAFSPMSILAGWVERSFDVPVQYPHDTDAREHHWASERCDQDQGFHSAVVCSIFESLVM
jgi:hypothetical protein